MKNDVARFGLPSEKDSNNSNVSERKFFCLPVQEHSRALHFGEVGLRENTKIIGTTAFEDIMDFKCAVMITNIHWTNSF